MRILLVGEYSRLHNSLKEGLENLGHQVTLIATGDYFKDYPADIKLIRKYDSGLGKKLKVLLYKLFNADITSISLMKQFFSYEDQLRGFDVVQLINECPLGAAPDEERRIITYLKENNDKLYLLSCGADHISVSYALGDNLRYSIMDGYKKQIVSRNEFDFALKYTTRPFIELHHYILDRINGIIASDIDYHIPLHGHPKYLGLVPNPINIDLIPFFDNNVEDRITIFLGINRCNYHTKGISYFEQALDIIKEKHSEKVRIEIVENLPYNTYIEIYNKAHIVLDQVLSYDQGYNALEAMAKGKVVLTGAEKEFESYYHLAEPVAVNVIPDVEYIVKAIENLIYNPNLISKIGKNAHNFIQKEHHYLLTAQKYLDLWKSN